MFGLAKVGREESNLLNHTDHQGSMCDNQRKGAAGGSGGAGEAAAPSQPPLNLEICVKPTGDPPPRINTILLINESRYNSIGGGLGESE